MVALVKAPELGSQGRVLVHRVEIGGKGKEDRRSSNLYRLPLLRVNVGSRKDILLVTTGIIVAANLAFNTWKLSALIAAAVACLGFCCKLGRTGSHRVRMRRTDSVEDVSFPALRSTTLSLPLMNQSEQKGEFAVLDGDEA